MEWNATVEDKIGINFKHRELLYLAMMHPSYAQQINEPEENNQRLKFLGEAILNFVITDYLYYNCPYLPMSKLSALRSKLLSGERLTKHWFLLGIGDSYPLLALKEERHRLRQKKNNPFIDAYFALVGAIHLDRGFSQTRNWLHKNLLTPTLGHHLKKIKKRDDPQQQLEFLSQALIKAIATDYIYRNLPYVSPNQLSHSYKQLASKQLLTAYNRQISLEDFSLLSEPPEGKKLPSQPFLVLLGSLYLEYDAANYKRSFPDASSWFTKKFVEEETILRQAIERLLKDGKSQKWIIRQVMGYESKNYHEGRERFHELMGE